MNGTPVIALFGSGYAGLGSGGSCHPYNRFARAIAAPSHEPWPPTFQPPTAVYGFNSGMSTQARFFQLSMPFSAS